MESYSFLDVKHEKAVEEAKRNVETTSHWTIGKLRNQLEIRTNRTSSTSDRTEEGNEDVQYIEVKIPTTYATNLLRRLATRSEDSKKRKRKRKRRVISLEKFKMFHSGETNSSGNGARQPPETEGLTSREVEEKKFMK